MNLPKITPQEWKVLCAVEEFWHRERFFPSSEELHEITDFEGSFINEVLESERAKKRFSALGISTDITPRIKKGELRKNETSLSDKQLAVAMVLLNPADKRSLTQKLNSLGVLPATYKGWTKNKVFMDFLKQQSEAMFGETMPLAHAALMNKVLTGDIRAIKLYYEISGRWDSKNVQNDQNFKLLIYKLIEIIQKYITDPTLLQIIAEEVKQLVEPPPVAKGEVINGNNASIIT